LEAKPVEHASAGHGNAAEALIQKRQFNGAA
jgi:hypothetical protein